MWSKEELIKKQKLTILVIITVIFALIFLGGSQALSKRPPSIPDYCAVVTGDIEGEGLVGMKRGMITSPLEVDFPLYFDTIKGVGEPNCGWLDVGFLKPSGRGSFYYSWDRGDKRYSLSGEGNYTYNKKEGSLFFISEGEEYTIQEIGWPPYSPWSGQLNFEINILMSDECGEPDCL